MATKYPISDIPTFEAKMIANCYDAPERGLIKVLIRTGMHISCVCELSEKNLKRKDKRLAISWKRPKTHKTMEFYLYKEDIDDIKAFLDPKVRRLKRKGYHCKIKNIGQRAGYDDIAPMTFRHNLCIKMMEKYNGDVNLVSQIMGCSPGVIYRNYAAYSQAQIEDKMIDDVKVED